jgi:hypothetical protein
MANLLGGSALDVEPTHPNPPAIIVANDGKSQSEAPEGPKERQKDT